MPEPRVFVSHAAMRRGSGGEEMVHDYSPAERYGALVFVTMGRRSWRDAGAFEPFARSFSDYDPRVDYLLPAGDPVAIAAAACEAANAASRAGMDHFRVLVWRGDCYQEVSVPLGPL